MAACGAPPVGDGVEAPPHQPARRRGTGVRPQLLIVVADDGDTGDARALRARVSAGVRAELERERLDRFGSCQEPDPAAWHPGDVRVVVARPSAPDDELWITPRDAPALAWVTRDSAPAEVGVVASAVSDALERRLARPGEPYRPIHAVRRSVELLGGARAPATAAERALVASLTPGAYVRFVVVSARDDELSAAAEPWRAADWVDVTVMGPFERGVHGCAAVGSAGARLWAWSAAASSRRAWPCDDEGEWTRLLPRTVSDCRRACEPWQVAVSSEGVADCSVTWTSGDLTRCDPEKGHHDPGGAPAFVTHGGVTLRACEVAQLRGRDLAACRASLECAGCASGWCATELEPLLASECVEGAAWHPWPLRFVGGAGVGAGVLGVACAPLRAPGAARR